MGRQCIIVKQRVASLRAIALSPSKMSKFTIRYYAPGALSSEGEEPSPCLLSIQSEAGDRFSVSIRPGDEGARSIEVDQRTAPVILLDLLRPGWRDCYEPHRLPLVVGEQVYRGFFMKRGSRIFNGTSWNVECLFSSYAFDEFDWHAAGRLVDAFYEAILSPNKANV